MLTQRETFFVLPDCKQNLFFFNLLYLCRHITWQIYQAVYALGEIKITFQTYLVFIILSLQKLRQGLGILFFCCCDTKKYLVSRLQITYPQDPVSLMFIPNGPWAKQANKKPKQTKTKNKQVEACDKGSRQCLGKNDIWSLPPAARLLYSWSEQGVCYQVFGGLHSWTSVTWSLGF